MLTASPKTGTAGHALRKRQPGVYMDHFLRSYTEERVYAYLQSVLGIV